MDKVEKMIKRYKAANTFDELKEAASDLINHYYYQLQVKNRSYKFLQVNYEAEKKMRQNLMGDEDGKEWLPYKEYNKLMSDIHYCKKYSELNKLGNTIDNLYIKGWQKTKLYQKLHYKRDEILDKNEES